MNKIRVKDYLSKMREKRPYHVKADTQDRNEIIRYLILFPEDIEEFCEIHFGSHVGGSALGSVFMSVVSSFYPEKLFELPVLFDYKWWSLNMEKFKSLYPKTFLKLCKAGYFNSEKMGYGK